LLLIRVETLNSSAPKQELCRNWLSLQPPKFMMMILMME